MVRDKINKGDKGLITLLFIFLMINIGFVFSAYGAVNAVTPSTNEQNIENGWAYVNQTYVGIGETTLEFVSERDFKSCFEYRTDGDTSQASSDPNENTDITDLYPYVCVNNEVKNMTIEADEFIEVRMVFGAERDERFDWTRFDVETIPELSHGTINLRYDSDAEVLEVWGESPEGATGAEIRISPVSDYDDVVYLDNTAILNDADNPNRYAFNEYQGNEVDVSGFDNVSYNVEVRFTDLGGSYKVSAIFNDLEIEGVQADLIVLYNEVEDLWIVVDNHTQEIEYLWNDSEQQWQAIDDLNNDVNNLYEENDMQWVAICMLAKENDLQWFSIFYLYNVAQYHEYKIDKLFKLIDEHNHGTINLMYSDEDANLNADTLRVWGEAPIGADYAKVMVFKQDGTLYKFAKVDVEDLLNNDNSYEHYFDTSDWDLESYNIVVMFYKELDNEQVVLFRGFNNDFRYMHEWMAGYNVGDTFNELELEQIQNDLVVLYNEVEDLWIAVDNNTEQIHYLWDDSKKQWISILYLKKENYMQWEAICNLYKENKMQWIAIWELKKENDMQWKNIFILYNIAKYHEYKINMLFDLLEEHNHATINLGFYNEDSNHDNDTLKVWGEAPLGAEYARIRIHYQNMSVFTSEITDVNEDNENGYVYHFDVTDWPVQTYNVRVNFFDSEDNYMSGYDVGGIFDGLTEFGFRNVLISTRVETMYSPNVGVPITYALQINENIGDAVIRVRSTDDSDVFIDKIIREQSLFAGQKYVFSDKLDFNELGYYDLEIYIEGENWVSDNFNVEVVNLLEGAPESSAFITSPDAIEGSYWHSWAINPSFDFALTLLEGTSANWCEWVIFKDGQNSEDGFLKISEVENVTLCDGTIYASEEFVEEGLYELIGRAEFAGGFSKKDEIVLGIDNTNPIVHSVSPDFGAFSGTFVINVNASDALSGIDMVWITMIPKNDSEGDTYMVEAFLNESSGYYEGVFDTVAMNISEGSYDILAEAYDLAGNSDFMIVDPMIDNTAPVINLDSSYFVTYENKDSVEVFVKAKAFDNLAGVDSVWVEFEGFECPLIADASGFFVTTNLCVAPFNKSDNMSLSGVVYAQDKAEPSNVASLDVMIQEVVDATPKVTTITTSSTSSGSSGGGGSGSGFTSLVINNDDNNDDVNEDEKATQSKTVIPEDEDTSLEKDSDDNDTNIGDSSSNNDGLLSDFEGDVEVLGGEPNVDSNTGVEEDSSEVGLAGMITGNIPTFAGLLVSVLVLGGVLIFGLRK